MRWIRYFSWLLHSTEALTIIQWRGVHNICESHRTLLLYETRNGSVSCKQPAKRSSCPASPRAPRCWTATTSTSATSGPTSSSWLPFTSSSTRWRTSSCGGDADRNKNLNATGKANYISPQASDITVSSWLTRHAKHSNRTAKKRDYVKQWNCDIRERRAKK